MIPLRIVPPLTFLLALVAVLAGAGSLEGESAAAAERTYYVSPAGNDQETGRSPDHAWRTLARVSRADLRPGDAVLLRAGGVWREMYEPSANGAPGRPITMGRYGDGRRPVISGQDAPGFAALSIVGRRNLEFSDLELRDRSESLVYLEGSHRIRFDRVSAHHALEGFHSSPEAGSSGIVVADSRVHHINGDVGAHGFNIASRDRGWRVVDTEIDHVPDSCVIDAATGSVYLRVRVHSCGFGNVDYGTHGLYLRGPRATVRDSSIWNTRNSCVSLRYQGDGVDGSRLHDCTVGIGFFDYATAPGKVKITRTRIWDTDTAIYLDRSRAVDFAISSTTVLGGRRNGAKSEGIVAGHVHGLKVTNTIVTGRVRVALRVESRPPGGFLDAGNVYFVTDRHPFEFGSGSARRDLREYQAASGAASSSISIDPGLVSASPSRPRLTLRSDSQARDRGTVRSAVGLLKPGCDGSPKRFCGRAPDPGAFELRDARARRESPG